MKSARPHAALAADQDHAAQRLTPGDVGATRDALVSFGRALRVGAPLTPALRRWLRACGDDTIVPALLDLAPDDVEAARAALDWRSIAVTPGAALVGALDALKSPPPVPDTTPEGELPPIDAPPGDALVDAWIREGRLHAYVQGHAARDPDFAEELAELARAAIDDQRADRTLPVGFAARRWLQRASGGTARFEAPVAGLHRLAAATGDHDTTGASIDLGFLAPLAATARVDYDARSATLSVFAEPGTLASVRWGDTSAQRLADGTWRATITLAKDPMVGEVTALDGTHCVFEVLAVARS